MDPINTQIVSTTPMGQQQRVQARPSCKYPFKSHDHQLKTSNSCVTTWLLYCLVTKSIDHANNAVFVMGKLDIIIILSI